MMVILQKKFHRLAFLERSEFLAPFLLLDETTL